MSTEIRAHKLRFSYSAQRPVLLEASASFGPGVSAVLGANGAGKSTFMEILAGERRPQSGDVNLGDENLVRNRSLRAHIGWVPQREVFDPRQRLRRFVADVGWYRGLRRRDTLTAADHALRLVGLHDRAHSRISELSGGMKRRAMIAAGMVNSPAVLLLDEPTAGLDPGHRKGLSQLLGELAGHGTCVVTSTHIAEDAERADRVLFLDRGRFVADLTATQLKDKYGGANAAFTALTEPGVS